MQSNSRLEILQQIEAALKRRLRVVDISLDTDEIYRPIMPDLITCFKNELEIINGKCILCDNEFDLYSKLKIFVQQQGFSYLFCRDPYILTQLEANGIPFSNNDNDFESMEAGITDCDFLVARTGSVLISSALESGRQMNVFPPIHIIIANVTQLIDSPENALNAIQKKYENNLPSIISTISGPSRTADIEKTLVLGAHGPKELLIYLCLA